MRRPCQGHDQVDAVSGEDQIFRVIMGKPHDILIILCQKRFKIINHILAKIPAHHVDIMPAFAFQDLIPGPQVEQIHPVIAHHFTSPDGKQLLRHAKGNGRRLKIDRQADVFIGRHDVGKQKGMRILQMISPKPLEIFKHHIENFIPRHQPIQGALGCSRCRREHRLEHRHQIPVGGGMQGIDFQIIFYSGKIRLERTLGRQTHSQRIHAGHQQFQQPFKRRNRRKVAFGHLIHRNGLTHEPFQKRNLLPLNDFPFPLLAGTEGQNLSQSRIRNRHPIAILDNFPTGQIPVAGRILHGKVHDFGALGGAIHKGMHIRPDRSYCSRRTQIHVRPGFQYRQHPFPERGQVHHVQGRQHRIQRTLKSTRRIQSHGHMEVGQSPMPFQIG